MTPPDIAPKHPVRAVIALGANLGDPLPALRAAVQEIAALPDTELEAVSSWYSTAPVESSGPDYVNGVLSVRTRLAPRGLLHRLQSLENLHGRVRPAGVRNAPRTMDLDVLLFGDLVSEDPEILLPHPRMHERAFVLVPLLEILPECEIPGRGSARGFLQAVRGQGIRLLCPA